jgi:hypothetical protein
VVIRHVLLWGLVAAMAVGVPAHARRLPGEGGTATLAVPEALREATVEAHTTVPLLERIPAGTRAAERLAHPSLPGRPSWRSSVLTDLQASDDFSSWTLQAGAPADVITSALSRCLGPSWWAGRALSAAGVIPTVSVGRNGIIIHFETGVGPVPELLADCPVERLPGPWRPGDEGRLATRADGQGLLEQIVVVDALADADVAEGDPSRPTGASLTAQAPDVLLLLQDQEVREADPFGLLGAAGHLRTRLDPDLLLEVFWGGRGAPTSGLLPPGLAPSRPRPRPTSDEAPELRIGPPVPGAPTLALAHDPSDVLVAGTWERLDVILRSRGWALHEDRASGDAQVLRWRPPSLDPALALLALAGDHPRFLQDLRLADPALLDPDPDRRFAAVTQVELAWIDEGRVLPLMTAERWITIHPDLRGVRLRPDGVPLLHDAYWSVPQ